MKRQSAKKRRSEVWKIAKLTLQFWVRKINGTLPKDKTENDFVVKINFNDFDEILVKYGLLGGSNNRTK